jgi:hypothetical protein
VDVKLVSESTPHWPKRDMFLITLKVVYTVQQRQETIGEMICTYGCDIRVSELEMESVEVLDQIFLEAVPGHLLHYARAKMEGLWAALDFPRFRISMHDFRKSHLSLLRCRPPTPEPLIAHVNDKMEKIYA